MTVQRHISLIRRMPLVLLAIAALAVVIMPVLVSKKLATWGSLVPVVFALVAGYSMFVMFILRPRCEKCGARMKMRHEETLMHVCPKCGLVCRSDHVIPESDMPT